MRARTAGAPLYAAGVTAILAAALAGCAATSSGTAATSSTATSSATASSPLDAVRLAAKTTSGASSFTGTVKVQATTKPGASSSGDIALTATMAERLRPSLVAELKIATLQAAGSALPGAIDEIVTPSTLYLKWSFLTQELHLTKPWLGIPVSSLSKGSGINFSQLFGQATSNSPLNQSQMLAGASDVRKVGQATIDGVAVTEYTGTLSLEKGVKYLSGSARSQAQKEITADGFTSATFTAWIDSQRVIRKTVIHENGTSLNETITVTVDTLNQPVNIAVPAAGQTGSLPSSALSSAG